MKEKRSMRGGAYLPILRVKTEGRDDQVEITIRDNGMGVSEEQLDSFYQSFIKAAPIARGIGLIQEAQGVALSLAHDIIVQLYKGKIDVRSREGEYLELIITLDLASKIGPS